MEGPPQGYGPGENGRAPPMKASTFIYGFFAILALSFLNLIVVYGTDYKAVLNKIGKVNGLEMNTEKKTNGEEEVKKEK